MIYGSGSMSHEEWIRLQAELLANQLGSGWMSDVARDANGGWQSGAVRGSVIVRECIMADGDRSYIATANGYSAFALEPQRAVHRLSDAITRGDRR